MASQNVALSSAHESRMAIMFLNCMPIGSVSLQTISFTGTTPAIVVLIMN